MRFDRVVAVDWSATSGRSRPGPDAIWTAEADGGGVGPAMHHPTRHAVTGWLAARLREAADGGERVLAVFDVSFGWPEGAARAVTGADDPLALWNWIGAALTDREDGTNDRYALAARLNGILPGEGPFWGRPHQHDLPGLPATKVRGAFGEWRATEDAMRRAGGTAGRPKSVWQLAYNGAVGSQTLTAMGALSRLRRTLGPRCAVWPFEDAADAPVVLAEVYLAHADPAEHLFRDGKPKDAGQVRAMAAGLLGAQGGRDVLALPPEPRARTEGWVLGIGFEAAIERAARAAAPSPPGGDDCFALPPGIRWTPVEEAWATLRALTPVAAAETVAVEAAAGRVLLRDVAALRAHPPQANAAVDGWGFAHAALPEGPMPVEPGRAAAGRPFGAAVPPGRALRILTGAALPAGVDTVALQEDAAEADGRVALRAVPRPGANTRAAGEDVRPGDAILRAGAVLRPSDLALAVAAGHATLPVRARLRVAVLSTGDEIAAMGGTPDANRPMLLAMLRAWGFEALDGGIVADDADALAAALDRAAGAADAVVTSGGASAGDEDHLSRLLRARGTVAHWRIAVKPGRPLALGRWRGAPLFGLPGNPVAAFTCAALFARPALLALAGAGWRPPRGWTVPAAFGKRKKAGRREYLRARLDAEGRAEVFRSEGSGRVSGIAWADGFVELPDAALAVEPGDPVRYLPFSEMGLG